MVVIDICTRCFGASRRSIHAASESEYRTRKGPTCFFEGVGGYDAYRGLEGAQKLRAVVRACVDKTVGAATARAHVTGYCSVAWNDIVKIRRRLAEQPHVEYAGRRAVQSEGGALAGVTPACRCSSIVMCVESGSCKANAFCWECKEIAKDQMLISLGLASSGVLIRRK